MTQRHSITPANNTITPIKLNTAGATAGQVLGYDGSSVFWRNDGLALPYAGRRDSAGIAIERGRFLPVRCHESDLARAELTEPLAMRENRLEIGAATGSEHRHARAVLETRVEHRLHVGNLVATGPGNVLDRDGQVS